MSSAFPEQETLTLINQSTSYQEYVAKSNEIEATRFEEYKKIPLMEYAQYYNLMRGQLTAAECEEKYKKIIAMNMAEYIAAYQKKEPLLEDNYKKIVNQVKSTSDLVNNICKEPAVELTTLAKKLLLHLNGTDLNIFLVTALAYNHFAIARYVIDAGFSLNESVFRDYVRDVKADSMEKMLFTFQDGITFFIKNNFLFNDKILKNLFEQQVPYVQIYTFYYVLTRHELVSNEIKLYLEDFKLSLLAATNQQGKIERLFEQQKSEKGSKHLIKNKVRFFIKCYILYLTAMENTHAGTEKVILLKQLKPAKEKNYLLEACDPRQQTLFSIACHFEHLELAKFLVTQGENINRKYESKRKMIYRNTNLVGSHQVSVDRVEKQYMSLFYFMIKAGKAKSAKYLLDNNIVVTQTEIESLLPECIKFINTSNYEMTELMLRAGIDINESHPGITSSPLFFYCHNSKMLQLLVKYGADLEKRDDENISFSHRLLKTYLERTGKVTTSRLIELLSDIFIIRGTFNYKGLKNPLNSMAQYYDSSIDDVCVLTTLINCNES
ncbi:MAG: hypothetical protein ACK4PR_12380, partial [Gammaproteobacteria bacterium]